MTTSTYPPGYPVHVEAHLDPRLSRGLWLIKWLLVIPHYLVLAFLWVSFVVLSVVAFFAIVLTGRYPRAIFDFNVGVLRWSWRVAYYAYGALATDRYPPFSMQEDPDYPAHLAVDYPQHLSRGLVLVKWWLLAIPHYVIVGIFVSGGIYLARDTRAWSDATPWVWGGGLIGLLVLIAAIVLLFTGTYPRQLFDLILGLNRWVLRVAAYAGLMTDQYPPFRLDQGGADPGSAAHPSPAPADVPPAAGTGSQGSHWGVGRVLAVVLASVVMVFSFGLLAAGTAAAVVNSTMRDASGFVMSNPRHLSTPTSALASQTIEVQTGAVVQNLPQRLFGDAKVTVTGHDDKPVFVGLAHAGDANGYLATLRHATVSGSYAHPRYEISGSHAPAARPDRQDIWVDHASGTGTQSVIVPVSEGHWSVVVMNADGTAGVDTIISVGATIPALGALTVVLLALGGALLIIPAVAVVVAVHGATTRPSTAPSQTGRDMTPPTPPR